MGPNKPKLANVMTANCALIKVIQCNIVLAKSSVMVGDFDTDIASTVVIVA